MLVGCNFATKEVRGLGGEKKGALEASGVSSSREETVAILANVGEVFLGVTLLIEPSVLERGDGGQEAGTKVLRAGLKTKASKDSSEHRQ